MKRYPYINKASGENEDGESSEWYDYLTGGEGPYAFKTLWKEATKAVGHIMTGITTLGVTRNTNSANTAAAFWTHARSSGDDEDNNIGFYLILGLVLIMGLIMYIIKKKKSK